MSKEKAQEKTKRRFGGTTTLARSAERITAPVFKQRGFAQTRILSDWPHIVGDTLAAYTLPQKLQFPASGTRTGGTLVLHASGAFALELQHMTPLVLERINTYFGYKAVERLRIVQVPVILPASLKPRAPSLPTPPSTGDALQDALTAMQVAIAHKTP